MNHGATHTTNGSTAFWGLLESSLYRNLRSHHSYPINFQSYWVKKITLLYFLPCHSQIQVLNKHINVQSKL